MNNKNTENHIPPEVALFVDNYYPVVDGVVRVVDNYARYINNKSYASVIVPTQDRNYVDNFPYDVLRAKSSFFFIKEYSLPCASLTKTIKENLSSHNYKIYHSHSPFFLGHYALKQGKKRNIPVISTFHSKYYDDALQITKSKFLANIVKKYIVNFYNKCDYVWACSSKTAETLKSYGYTGDIFVADNGTDYLYPNNPEEIAINAIKKYNLNKNIPTILFIGHQIWQKNLKLVLDTALELLNRSFKFRLLVVGTGYAENEISDYAKKIGLTDDNVTFIRKSQNKEQLMELELASDLFFFPSVYDNAPLVLREAAAMRLPGLLIKDTNAAEPIIDGYNGFLCTNDFKNTAETIIRIFSDRNRIKEVGENAAKSIGKHWNDILPIIINEYNRILNT